jgi:hypothetical protein
MPQPETPTARVLAQRIIASVPEEQQVAMDRALHNFETTIRAEARAAAFAEAATALDRIADDLEEQAILNDGQAYGRANKTVATYREAAAVPRRMAAVAAPGGE